MTKNEFLTRFEAELRLMGIPDADEIAEEYREHFEAKTADGFTEEETAARLGAPEEVAGQYSADMRRAVRGNRGIVITGLVFADILVVIIFILLYAWCIVCTVFTAAALSVGVCLILGFGSVELIPPMPYGCAVLFAMSLFATAVLAAAGTAYFFGFTRQLTRAYGRWAENTLASASGLPTLPALPVYPRLSPKARRRIRSVVLAALIVFAVASIAAYIVSAVWAKSIEFWHVWNWFVG